MVRACVALFVVAASLSARAQDGVPAGDVVVAAPDSAWSPVADAAAPDSSEAVRPLVVVSSGGISAGAYQAGVNWTILNLLRLSETNGWRDRSGAAPLLDPHELVVATGASAGGINSVLAAIEWGRPQGETMAAPSSSLYWNVWTGIGLSELLPRQRDSDARGRDTESALSRRYLTQEVFEVVREGLSSDSLRLDRPVATGFALSTRTPHRVNVASGLAVESMRMVSVQQVSPLTTPGGAPAGLGVEPFDFVHTVPDSLFGFGTLRHLPLLPLARAGGLRARVCVPGATPAADQRARAARNADRVLELSSASAAFPYAWGPVELDVVREVAADGFPTVRAEDQETREFIDGGVFDNNPLGLALDLYKRVRLRDQTCRESAPDLTWDRPTILFTDPDSERAWEPTPERKRARGGENRFADLLSLAGQFVTTGRQYEIESEARDLAGARGWLTSTDRRFPIVGTELLAFGAFLARPFRVYDFYAGVYDGFVYAATHLHADGGSRDDLGSAVRELYERSGLCQRDPLVDVVFRPFAEAEFGAAGTPSACRPADPDDAQSRWASVLGAHVDAALENQGADRWFGALTTRLSESVPDPLRAMQCPESESRPGAGLACDLEPHALGIIQQPDFRLRQIASEVLNYRVAYETGPSRQATAAAMAVLNMGLTADRPGLHFNRSAVPYYADGLYERSALRGPHKYNPWKVAGRHALRWALPSRAVLSTGSSYSAWGWSRGVGNGYTALLEVAPFRADELVLPDAQSQGQLSYRTWTSSVHLGLDAPLTPGLALGGRGLFAWDHEWFCGNGTDAGPFGRNAIGAEAFLRLGHFGSVGVSKMVTGSRWTDASGAPVRFDRRVRFTVALHDVGGLLYWLPQIALQRN